MIDKYCKCEFCGGFFVINPKKRASRYCRKLCADRAYRARRKAGLEPVVRKHGLSYHPLYTVWREMRRRCNNPNSARYAEYGGRGIKVCERWNNSFEDYYLDIDALGPKPGPEYTIDRINNDGDYEPGNVRWASKTQQNLNQRLRRDNPSGYKGVTYERGVRHWVAKFGYGGTMHTIGRFFTLEEAAAARESVMQQLFGIEASN